MTVETIAIWVSLDRWPAPGGVPHEARKRWAAGTFPLVRREHGGEWIFWASGLGGGGGCGGDGRVVGAALPDRCSSKVLASARVRSAPGRRSLDQDGGDRQADGQHGPGPRLSRDLRGLTPSDPAPPFATGPRPPSRSPTPGEGGIRTMAQATKTPPAVNASFAAPRPHPRQAHRGGERPARPHRHPRQRQGETAGGQGHRGRERPGDRRGHLPARRQRGSHPFGKYSGSEVTVDGEE